MNRSSAGLGGGNTHGHQQRQTTNERQNECALRSRFTATPTRPGNKHKRRQRHQLPGDEQQKHVVGKHQQQHRSHKRRHERIKIRGARTPGRQIRGGIQEHHRPNNQRKQRKNSGQTIKPHTKTNIRQRTRHPRVAYGNRLHQRSGQLAGQKNSVGKSQHTQRISRLSANNLHQNRGEDNRNRCHAKYNY